MAKALINFQLLIGETPIDEVKLDLYSRDQMPKFLFGIQAIYNEKKCLHQILDLIKRDITTNSSEKNRNKGAPSEFTAWELFVLINLYQNEGYDYDQLADLASYHIPLRQIMGLKMIADKPIAKSTLHENLKLIKSETIQKIMEIVVKFGHSKLNPKKKPLETVADTFVYESNIHFHTDYGSIYDGVRCLLRIGSRLAHILNLAGFRKKSDIEKKVKRYCREIGAINRGGRKDKEEAIKITFTKLTKLMFLVFNKCIEMLLASENFKGNESVSKKVLKLREEIKKYLKVTIYESGLAKRRLLYGETIEASEKIYSIFEQHVEMICKGKVKAPMEFGHRVLVIQDQFGFILTCKRPEMGLVDEKIITSEILDVKAKHGSLRSLSLDKGFWSPENHEKLSKEVDVLVLPSKGKAIKYEDQTPEYKKLRRKHSRVESCINALESGNNLHVCLGKGLESFDMAIACAGVARNLHVIGHYLQQKKKKEVKHQNEYLKLLCG